MAHLENDLSIVLHLLDEAIIIVDEKQHITVANRGAEKIFGYDPGELPGKSLNILLPARFVAAHQEHMHRFAEASGVFHSMGAHRQISGLRKDGSEFPAEASISRMVNDDHIIFAVILRDVTARKESERQLLELTLEHERTNQMSELIGDISHDLKTPISVIHANVYLIKHAKKPQDHERSLDAIIDAD
jgi:PAS domain S-box-containing protein